MSNNMTTAEHDITAIFTAHPLGHASTETMYSRVAWAFRENWDMLIGVSEFVQKMPRELQLTLILESWYSLKPYRDFVEMAPHLPDTVLRRMAIVALLGVTWRHVPIAPLYASIFPREQVTPRASSHTRPEAVPVLQSAPGDSGDGDSQRD